MHQTVAREEGAIPHLDVAGEQHAVGEDDVVAQPCVVADVRVGHEEVVRAEDRVLGELVRAVHGDVLAEDVVVADDEAGWLVLIFQVLRHVADDAAGVEAVPRADGRVPREVRVRAHHAARPERHVRLNHSVGAHLHISGEPCGGGDDSGGMEHGE